MGAQEPVTGVSPIDDDFCAQRLERVFADCFSRLWRTRLQGGAPEPLYQPATGEGGYHLLNYRGDYFASALHEVAHWCIAGTRRRQLPDFGYWYLPDGRNATQQQAFEAVEFRPQALEWYFSRACGYRFRISVDNLGAGGDGLVDPGPFKRRILRQAQYWQRESLPPRAGLFFDGLCREFDTGLAPAELAFSLADLD